MKKPYFGEIGFHDCGWFPPLLMLSRALASPTRYGNCAEQLKQASPMKQPYFGEIGFHDCGLVCGLVDVVLGMETVRLNGSSRQAP